MTRRECEEKILELLKQIADVCNQYQPGIDLCLSVDTNRPMWWAFCRKDDEYLLDVCHFSDGTNRFGDTYVRPVKSNDKAY